MSQQKEPASRFNHPFPANFCQDTGQLFVSHVVKALVLKPALRIYTPFNPSWNEPSCTNAPFMESVYFALAVQLFVHENIT